MLATQRERNIALIAAGALTLLALDYYALTPLLENHDALAVRRQTLQREVEEANKTFTNSRLATQRWKAYRAAGLAADASMTESSLLNALRGWSQETNLPLLSIRPDRASGSHGLCELTFQAGGDGTLRAIAGFLYRLEMARLPVRIREVQIAARIEGTDNLMLQLRVSTLWDDSKPSPAAAPQNEKAQP